MSLKSIYILLLLVLAGVYARAQSGAEISISYGQNRFINKSPFRIIDSLVCFFLRGNTKAKQVILSGNFINWSPDAIAMTKVDSGWLTYVKLVPGRYLYKFIIDGTWVTDSDNNMKEEEGEIVNSLFFVPNIVFKFPGFMTASKVYLALSKNGFISDELPMTKTRYGWELPLFLSDDIYAYHFVADGKPFLDPANKQQVTDNKGKQRSAICIDQEESMMQAFGSYQKALAINNSYEMARSITVVGDIYFARSDYSNALHNFQQALSLYQRLNYDDSSGAMYLRMEKVFNSLSDYPAELTHLQNAIKAFERTDNNAGLAEVNMRMGSYYNSLKQRFRATEYWEKALALFQKLDNKIQIANALRLIGFSTSFYDKAKATEILNRSLEYSQKIGYEDGIASTLVTLGLDYGNKRRDLLNAAKKYNTALELYNRNNNKLGVATTLLYLTYIYLEAPDSILKNLDVIPSQKYEMVIAYQKKSMHLFEELKLQVHHQGTMLQISQTYERMGKFDSALHYFRKWLEARDKYYNTQKQTDIARIETKYENEKIEDSLKADKILTDEKLRQQLLLARQQQQQLELNEAQLILSNKEKDLQHLAFLKTQSDLENEKLVKQQKEKENHLQSAQVKSLTQRNEIIQLNQQRQWIYIAGGFVLLALGSLYFIYHSRLRRVKLEAQLIKEKAEQEKKETEFQQKLADVSMSALRSQMNPHFIFNCLNSIKLYTTQNDSVAASEYLTKFSKLIRLILENSRNERITLSSELAALELYIEMEAMRFKEKLSYSFSVEKNVETDYIEIPPLLLQPYVENAIWHGLMPREEGGHISIIVSINEDESLLEINITDNGIGRKAAAILREKVAGKHRSYGMKATTERIALINQIYKTGANVVVHDLVDEKGQPRGTRVCIEIPV
jgi:tetratricopeptide (TPR) repeat protein